MSAHPPACTAAPPPAWRMQARCPATHWPSSAAPLHRELVEQSAEAVMQQSVRTLAREPMCIALGSQPTVGTAARELQQGAAMHLCSGRSAAPCAPPSHSRPPPAAAGGGGRVWGWRHGLKATMRQQASDPMLLKVVWAGHLSWSHVHDTQQHSTASTSVARHL